MFVDGEGLFILDVDGRCFVGGLEAFILASAVGVEVFGFVSSPRNALTPVAAVYSSAASL